MTEEKMIEEILYESHSVGMRSDNSKFMISWVLKILKTVELIYQQNT